MATFVASIYLFTMNAFFWIISCCVTGAKNAENLWSKISTCFSDIINGLSKDLQRDPHVLEPQPRGCFLRGARARGHQVRQGREALHRGRVQGQDSTEFNFGLGDGFQLRFTHWYLNHIISQPRAHQLAWEDFVPIESAL